MTDQDKLDEVTAKLLGGHEVLLPNPSPVQAGMALHVTVPVFISHRWIELQRTFVMDRAGAVIGVSVSPDRSQITGLLWR